MTIDDWVLIGAVTLLTSNRLLHMGQRWYRRRAMFWGMQFANLVAACWFVLYGVPAFSGRLRSIDLVLAALFVVHIIQNNGRYQAAKKGGDDPAERERKRQQVLDKLKGGGE